MFPSQSLISSHRGHSTKREIHKGEFHLSFRIPESHRKKKIPCDPTKRSFHVIPQRECEQKIRALKIYFLQSWVCSMGWSGDRERERERGVATSHFQSHKDKGSAKKTKSDREKLFCSQGPISSHSTKREIHKRELHLHFRSQNCRAKKTSHFIPQSVHSISFHRGNAEKQFYRA